MQSSSPSEKMLNGGSLTSGAESGEPLQSIENTFIDPRLHDFVALAELMMEASEHSSHPFSLDDLSMVLGNKGLWLALTMIDSDSARIHSLSQGVVDILEKKVASGDIDAHSIEWIRSWRNSEYVTTNTFVALASQMIALRTWKQLRSLETTLEAVEQFDNLVLSNTPTDGGGIGLINKVSHSVGTIAIQAMFELTGDALKEVIGELQNSSDGLPEVGKDSSIEDKIRYIFKKDNELSTNSETRSRVFCNQSRYGGDEGNILLSVDLNRFPELELTYTEKQIIQRTFDYLGVSVVTRVNTLYREKDMKVPIQSKYLDEYISSHASWIGKRKSAMIVAQNIHLINSITREVQALVRKGVTTEWAQDMVLRQYGYSHQVTFSGVIEQLQTPSEIDPDPIITEDILAQEWTDQIRFIAPKLKQEKVSDELCATIAESDFAGLVRLAQEEVERSALKSKRTRDELSSLDEMKLQIIREYIIPSDSLDPDQLDTYEQTLNRLISITKTFYLLERGRDESEMDIVKDLLLKLPHFFDQYTPIESGEMLFAYMDYLFDQLNTSRRVLPYLLGLPLKKEKKLELSKKLSLMIQQSHPKIYQQLIDEMIFRMRSTSGIDRASTLMRLTGLMLIDPVTWSIHASPDQLSHVLDQPGMIREGFVIKARTKIANSINPIDGDGQIREINDFITTILSDFPHTVEFNDLGVQLEDIDQECAQCLTLFAKKARKSTFEKAPQPLDLDIKQMFAMESLEIVTDEYDIDIPAIVNSIIAKAVVQGRKGADTFLIISEPGITQIKRDFSVALREISSDNKAVLQNTFGRIVESVVQALSRYIQRIEASTSEINYVTYQTFKKPLDTSAGVDEVRHTTEPVYASFPYTVTPLVLKNKLYDPIATDERVEQNLTYRWIRRFLYSLDPVFDPNEHILSSRKSPYPRIKPIAIITMLSMIRSLKGDLGRAIERGEKISFNFTPPSSHFEVILNELKVFVENSRGFKYTKLVNGMLQGFSARFEWMLSLLELPTTSDVYASRKSVHSPQKLGELVTLAAGYSKAINQTGITGSARRLDLSWYNTLSDYTYYPSDEHSDIQRPGGYNIEFFFGIHYSQADLVRNIIASMSVRDKQQFIEVVAIARNFYDELVSEVQSLSDITDRYSQTITNIQMGNPQ
jgi:hypothetical protein